MKRLLTAVMLVLFASFIAHADDLQVVKAEGQATLGDDTTIAQAKAAALNNARRAALEKATGLEVHGSSTVYNLQLINDLVVAATRGIIVQEKILESTCRTKDEHIWCTTKIEASVKPLQTEKRGNFMVTTASVMRPDRDKASKNPVFQNKDEIQIRVAANQDAYLNLFSVDQYGGISRLYPNTYCAQEHQTAEKELLFPDSSQRKAGLKLRVATPKGVKQAVESVLVIATREKVQLLADSSIEHPTITDLMRELSEHDHASWVDKTVGYEVRE